MARPVVLLGDIGTNHGAFPPTPVIAGSATVQLDGRPLARIGDPLAPHTAPYNSVHPRFIAVGDPSVLVDGQPVALSGDPVTCGGVVIGTGSAVGL